MSEKIHEPALIDTGAWVGLGVIVERGATIQRGARIGIGAWIGRGARIGIGAWVGLGVIVERGAIIGIDAQIERGAIIGIDAQIESGTTIGRGARIGRCRRGVTRALAIRGIGETKSFTAHDSTDGLVIVIGCMNDYQGLPPDEARAEIGKKYPSDHEYYDAIALAEKWYRR